ncbi:hypothetical protein AVEN_257541-1 [Araneus ventricosus]|uniref:Uncharacterized protein n=1 Tax=Araneus ventricosus TaxID=182803 RepID=A0A4Y2UHW2_ARAVE|nr:hypothetical protein AVEN_257541-1 [Araneus ventricosus]
MAYSEITPYQQTAEANTKNSLSERPTCGVLHTMKSSRLLSCWTSRTRCALTTTETAELFSTLILAEIKDRDSCSYFLMTPAPPRPADKPPPHRRIQMGTFATHAVISPDRHTVETVNHQAVKAREN